MLLCTEGKPKVGAPCPPLPHWVLSAMPRAPAHCGRGCTGCWHHVLLSCCCVQESAWGIWLGPDPVLESPTLRHTWDAGAGQVTGMLLSTCSSPVTNPFHLPDPTIPHPTGFLSSPAPGCKKVWHRGGWDLVLTGWLSSPRWGCQTPLA